MGTPTKKYFFDCRDCKKSFHRRLVKSSAIKMFQGEMPTCVNCGSNNIARKGYYEPTWSYGQNDPFSQ